MQVSQSTRKIHRNEKIAKVLIWTAAGLTMLVLFWIISFILIRGFYSNRLVRYDYLNVTEEELPLDNGDEVIFISHRKIRVKDLTTENLQALYTSPIRELNTWGEISGQDMLCKPAVYIEDSSFNTAVQDFLLSSSDLDDWKNYTVKKHSPREMIDYVASTPGAVGFIPVESSDLLNSRVQVLPLRDLVLRVNPSVTSIVNNRSLQALSEEDFISIITGEVQRWDQIGGRDLELQLHLAPSVQPELFSKWDPESLPVASSRESLETFLQENPGAIIIDRYGAPLEGAIAELPVDRRERGPNLNLAFILEKPAGGDAGGISYFIINTFLLILLTLLISTPVGIMAAVYLVEYARQGPFVNVLRMGTETLAGIPSIVFGLFGRIFFVRILGLGIGFLSSTLTVTLMILPTLVRTTEEALKAVPGSLREGSLAMGATKLQTLIRVVLPAASKGILTGVILAVGRVVGETAVLLYTLGSGYDLVRNLSSPARVLSLHLYLLFSEAVSFDRAFATATVLIIMILLSNLLTRKVINSQKV